MTIDNDFIRWRCSHVMPDKPAWGRVTVYTDGGVVVAEGCEPCTLAIRDELLKLKGGNEEVVKLVILDQPEL